MVSYLLLRVIVPLSILAIVSVYFHTIREWDGFFINLTTEIIGIGITIAYVDWVIRKHEAEQWEEPTRRISNKLQVFAATAVARIRMSFGYGIEIIDTSKIRLPYSSDARSEAIRIAEKVLEPTAKERIGFFDVKEWRVFIKNLKAIEEPIDKFLMAFGTKLTPRQTALLLDIEDKVRIIVGQYMIVTEILGVPDEEFPEKTRLVQSGLKRKATDGIVEHVESLIKTIVELIKTLE